MITDLLSPEAATDPHAVYRELRRHAPITWLPEHRAWFVSTYDGVRDGFRDVRLSSDRLTPLEQRLAPDKRALLGDTFELLRGWMVFHDPPHHERLKAPVRTAFTPRAVESLRPHVERVVDACLDDMEERLRSNETVDLVTELAFPLPAIVIAELLGVPPADRDDFKSWSNQLAALVFGASGSPEQAGSAAAGSARFAAYFTDLIAHYERHPADNLISALIAARSEASPPLGATELVGACTLLLFGGHETTTGLIGLSALALLRHPEQRQFLIDRPDLVEAALDELHRYDGPTKVMVRIVGEPVHRDGVTMEPGQTVFLGVASANRDPAQFDEPDRLVLDRPGSARHVGFGHGLHFCLGAPLARLESQIAIGRLVRRLPNLELTVEPGDLRWASTILGRGLGSLPVALPA